MSKIWGPSPKNYGGPKISVFRLDFGQLRETIANICVREQDVVNQKTALQSAIIPVHADYMVNFRPQKAKEGEKIGPYSNLPKIHL